MATDPCRAPGSTHCVESRQQSPRQLFTCAIMGSTGDAILEKSRTVASLSAAFLPWIVRCVWACFCRIRAEAHEPIVFDGGI